MAIRIPFNRPSLCGNELNYIREAVSSGQISGSGKFTRSCESLLEELLGAARVILTTSCTDALELSALLTNVDHGSEVIVPSFTFVSTANAFALRGAKIVFADVRPDTLNMDENMVETLITSRTKAIVPVHYSGVACDMDRLLDIQHRQNVPMLIEDNAHGLLGEYQGRVLGSFGALSALSFHETKNFSCGEGGALVINDAALAERAEVIRDKGTNRKQFLAGHAEKYTWIELGSSYALSDLLAAYLLAQLEAREQIQAARERIWQRYFEELSGWAAKHGARLPIVPAQCKQTCHLFYVLAPDQAFRDRLLQHLRDNEILGVFHYVPLHFSPMGRKYGANFGDCPVAEDVSSRLLRLPLYNDLSAEDQSRVIETIQNFS